MKTSPKCSVTQFVPSHTIPHPNAPSFRTLGPKLARKRFAAAWWIPSYLTRFGPIKGTGYPLDHSFAAAIRIVLNCCSDSVEVSERSSVRP